MRAHAPETEAEARGEEHEGRESQHKRTHGERPDGAVLRQRSHTHVSLFFAYKSPEVKIRNLSVPTTEIRARYETFSILQRPQPLAGDNGEPRRRRRDEFVEGTVNSPRFIRP